MIFKSVWNGNKTFHFRNTYGFVEKRATQICIGEKRASQRAERTFYNVN